MTLSDALHVQNRDVHRTGGRGDLAPTRVVFIVGGGPQEMAAIQTISSESALGETRPLAAARVFLSHLC
jgi:hypothetical protein